MPLTVSSKSASLYSPILSPPTPLTGSEMLSSVSSNCALYSAALSVEGLILLFETVSVRFNASAADSATSSSKSSSSKSVENDSSKFVLFNFWALVDMGGPVSSSSNVS